MMKKENTTQIEEMKEDAAEFAEIWKRIPKERRPEGIGIMKGFAAAVSIEEDKSA